MVKLDVEFVPIDSVNDRSAVNKGGVSSDDPIMIITTVITEMTRRKKISIIVTDGL